MHHGLVLTSSTFPRGCTLLLPPPSHRGAKHWSAADVQACCCNTTTEEGRAKSLLSLLLGSRNTSIFCFVMFSFSFPGRKAAFAPSCAAQLPGSALAAVWMAQCFGEALAWLSACPAVPPLLGRCAWMASRARSVVVPLAWIWKQPLSTMAGLFSSLEVVGSLDLCNCSSAGCVWFWVMGTATSPELLSCVPALRHSQVASRKFSPHESLACHSFFPLSFETEAFV